MSTKEGEKTHRDRRTRVSRAPIPQLTWQAYIHAVELFDSGERRKHEAESKGKGILREPERVQNLRSETKGGDWEHC